MEVDLLSVGRADDGKEPQQWDRLIPPQELHRLQHSPITPHSAAAHAKLPGLYPYSRVYLRDYYTEPVIPNNFLTLSALCSPTEMLRQAAPGACSNLRWAPRESISLKIGKKSSPSKVLIHEMELRH